MHDGEILSDLMNAQVKQKLNSVETVRHESLGTHWKK